MASLLTFPKDPTSVESWRAFVSNSQLDTSELLAYVFQLYDRERALSVRYHQTLLSLAHLADGYTTTNEAAAAHVLTQCVDCNQSVVVDGADYGRLLPCGHVMHSFCMATYCDTTHAAPGCRRCGVRFFPASCDPRSQLKVATVLTAVRVLNGTPLTVLRQDFVDTNFEPTCDLERLILAAEHDEVAIKEAAAAEITQHKKFLRELATVVAEKLIPTINEPRPYPAVPTATVEPPAKKAATAPPPAKQVAAAMPPHLEPDVLPPVNAAIPKGTRFQNRSVMFTGFTSKCKMCKRIQEQGRSIIASGEQGFACCLCVFEKTSAAIYEELFGTPSVDSMFE